MKIYVFSIVVFLSFSVVVNAAYDHVIEDDYFGALTLNDHKTLLMTGGGGA